MWKKILWYVGLGVISAAGAVIPEIMMDKASEKRVNELIKNIPEEAEDDGKN